MIDMHTHILPCIDDGTKDEEMAKQMVESVYAQGVKNIVFTPHYYGKLSTDEFIQKREEVFFAIKDSIPEDVKTYMGAEVHFAGANLFQLEALGKLRIGETRYILIELPFLEKWSQTLLSKLSDFMDETDCTPIIAHVERYKEVRKNPAIISVLVKMGCLIQVNASAFLEKKDKSFAFALLKKGLVHCLGSDVHDMELRACRYEQAKSEIEKAGFGGQLEKIHENMVRVLENKTVRTPEIRSVKKFFGLYY